MKRQLREICCHKPSFATLFAGVVFALALGGASTANAAMPGALGAPASGTNSSSKGGKSFGLTLPVMPLTRDTAARVEYNIGAVALAIEGAAMGESEEYSAEKMLLTGDSMVSSGRQASLLITNYAQPGRLAGWFWMIGAGVRTMKGVWRTNPSQLATLTGIPLVPDANGKVLHRYEAEGSTGHIRVGYRWVSQSIPFSLGAHVGLRHFDGRFKDADEEPQADVTRLAIDDQSALRRRYMTRLEPAVEFGLVF